MVSVETCRAHRDARAMVSVATIAVFVFLFLTGGWSLRTNIAAQDTENED